MKNRIMMAAVLALLAGPACEDDSAEVVCCDPPPPPGPTTREYVLSNIELAYNRRHINRYQEVLDENFTFFFASGDVGGDIPIQWGRQEEIDSNMHLFDPNYVDTDPSDGTYAAVKKIFMDVKWEDGLQWQKITVDGGEEWFSATVFYNFQVDIGLDDHFINNPGAKAQFTVRNAGTADAPHWQLVEMRDLGDGGLPATSLAGTDQSTWGAMKARYR